MGNYNIQIDRNLPFNLIAQTCFPSRPSALVGSRLANKRKGKKGKWTTSILPCSWLSFISSTQILSFPPVHIIAVAGFPLHQNKNNICFTLYFNVKLFLCGYYCKSLIKAFPIDYPSDHYTQYCLIHIIKRNCTFLQRIMKYDIK